MTHSPSTIQHSTFPRYTRYKDSGVEWLGEVPEHWEVVRAKRVFKNVAEKGYPNEALLSATQDKGVIPRDQLEQRVVMPLGQLQTFKLVRRDDFVISLRSFQGGIEHSAYRGLVSPAYTVLRLNRKDASPGFLRHLLKASTFISELNVSVTGIRQGKNIDFAEFAESFLPLPPKPEQDRIVAFLDRKTAEIDALIAKKQRQIELLDEQKAILIHRAVTRGLNPRAKLKPSGIEWIGEIPEHWEVKSLKHVSKKIGTGRTPSTVAQAEDLPDGIHWYTPGDYRDTGFLDASERRAKDTRIETVETFPAGSLFYIGIGATLGRVNLSLHEAGCNQQINVIVIGSSAHSAEYMLHLLNAGREYIFSSSDFTTLPILNRTKTAALPVVAPPNDEQEAIAAFCADLVLKIQAVQGKVAENIQTLQTLRSTLISHAVTGRIKV
jgi:type I restriction enzyme, S subunit